jgi:hypothetical protein
MHNNIFPRNNLQYSKSGIDQFVKKLFSESEGSSETSLMGKNEEEIVPNPKPTKLRAGDEWKRIQSQISGCTISGGAVGARITRATVGTTIGGIVERSTISGDGVAEGGLGAGDAGLAAALPKEASNKRQIGTAGARIKLIDIPRATVGTTKSTNTGGIVERSTVSGDGVAEGGLGAGGAGLAAALPKKASDEWQIGIVPVPGTLIGTAVGATIGGTAGVGTVGGAGVGATIGGIAGVGTVGGAGVGTTIGVIAGVGTVGGAGMAASLSDEDDEKQLN